VVVHQDRRRLDALADLVAGAGIYAIAGEGGAARWSPATAREPHFGAGASGCSSPSYGDEDKVELASVELDGSDLRTHVKTENGDAPAGLARRALARVDRGLSGAGRPVPADRAADRARAEGEALPVARVSRDAGELRALVG
jgi:hypothetical protein